MPDAVAAEATSAPAPHTATQEEAYDELSKTLRALASHINNLATQQETLVRMVKAGTDHVLRLQQTIDPLTARKRAALLFGGAFTGGGTAALLMHMILRFLSATAQPAPTLPPTPALVAPSVR